VPPTRQTAGNRSLNDSAELRGVSVAQNVRSKYHEMAKKYSNEQQQLIANQIS